VILRLFFDSEDITFAAIGDAGSEVDIALSFIAQLGKDSIEGILVGPRGKQKTPFPPKWILDITGILTFPNRMLKLRSNLLEGFCFVFIRHDIKKKWGIHHGNCQLGIADGPSINWLTTPKNLTAGLDEYDFNVIELDYDQDVRYVLATDGYWDADKKTTDSASHLFLSSNNNLPPSDSRDSDNFQVIMVFELDPQINTAEILFLENIPDDDLK